MKIEEAHKDSDSFAGLQRFVQKNELLFNSSAWLNNYPARNIRQCVIKNNNDEIIGCFIYYIFKKAIFDFIITPPFSPSSDLFYVNPAESVVGKNTFDKEVMAAISSYFDSLGTPYINLNMPYPVVDTQPFTWLGYTSKIRYSYLIDLGHSQEELLNNLSSEKRKSLNKAAKDGLVISSTTDYELVYSLVIQSLERNDKARNLEVIKNILFSYASPQNAIAFVAFHNNKPIGASFSVIEKKKAVYLFGGFNTDNKHHGAGVSCMWQSILKAKELGLSQFDFEGSMNVSIERYFREFGGQLSPYFCVEKVKPFLAMMLKLKGHNPT